MVCVYICIICRYLYGRLHNAYCTAYILPESIIYEMNHIDISCIHFTGIFSFRQSVKMHFFLFLSIIMIDKYIPITRSVNLYYSAWNVLFKTLICFFYLLMRYSCTREKRKIFLWLNMTNKCVAGYKWSIISSLLIFFNTEINTELMVNIHK